MVGFENNSSVMAVSECDSAGNRTQPPLETKKKRNLPGNPDRDAEVIALSPKSLVATNRFICEICNKGFQRDQNLQLHRRGHNLPWKLKQRTGKEIRKRVYVCPEKTCVHHDPLRALGDLTGIKKHFSRKHGEKKWKCERCTKKYAVQSDWKAHMKICGLKEYRCDCGSLFSRRDSFITHRAFCDVLTHESTRNPQSQTLAVSNSDQPLLQSQPPPLTDAAVVLPTPTCSPPPPPLTPSTDVLSPAISFQTPELPENSIVVKRSLTTTATTTASTATTTVSGGSTSNSTTVFPSIYTSSVSLEPMSLSLSSSLYLSNTANPPLFPPPAHNLLHTLHHRYPPSSQPALSATALLQKAAEMGAKSSNTSFLHALGLASPSPTVGNHRQDTNNGSEWSNVHIKQERDDNNFRLGLGIPFASTTTTTSLTDLMMGPPAPTTLDFLGLGMGGGGGGGGSSGGFSAYLASTGGGYHAGGGGVSAVPLFRGMNSGWDDSDDRNPDLL